MAMVGGLNELNVVESGQNRCCGGEYTVRAWIHRSYLNLPTSKVRVVSLMAVWAVCDLLENNSLE
jgi:hypothetical protein